MVKIDKNEFYIVCMKQGPGLHNSVLNCLSEYLRVLPKVLIMSDLFDIFANAWE